MTNAISKVRSLLTPGLAIDAATLAVSLGIADQLYQFHRFSLEAISFLLTWWGMRTVARFFIR